VTIRVLLADDHRIMREGLRSLLDQQDDMKVVGEAEDGREAVRLACKLAPSVAVVDVAMPDLNGIETARRILADSPHVKVLALSMHMDRRLVLGMLDAGASGYLLKDCAFDELVTAIRAVAAGGVYLSPKIAGHVVNDRARHADPAASPSSALTAKERETVQLIAEGRSTKEIAALMGVSIKTVETHRQHVMTKLGYRSVAELTKFAIREGITFIEDPI